MGVVVGPQRSVTGGHAGGVSRGTGHYLTHSQSTCKAGRLSVTPGIGSSRMSGEIPQNLAMLRAAFGSGPLFAPTDDDLITFEGVELISGYEHASTPERFVIVKQPPHRDAFIEMCRSVRGGRLVELGIAEGGSTVLAALAAEPSALLAVDIEPEPLAALEEFIAARDLGARVHTRYGIDQGDRDQLAAHRRRGDRDRAPRLGGRRCVPRARPDPHLVRGALPPAGSRGPVRHRGLERGPCLPRGDDRALQHRLDRRAGRAGPLAPRGGHELADARPPARRPLLDLAVELILARARGAEDAIAEVVVNRYWLMVRRGPAALDGTTFRLADVAHDHFGYLR